MLVVGPDELRNTLNMKAAVDALEHAFAEEDPAAAGPVRSSMTTPAGTLLLMPAAGARGVGVKLVTLTDANPARGLPLVDATYVLFDPGTQQVEAVLDGAALTALRTAAVSGLATRWLARPRASRLVVLGAGVQARAHIEAMRAVRAIEDVAIVSRTPDRAAALAADVGGRMGDASDLARADIVCTCTTSREPVVAGSSLPAGVHVNAVGAYLPDARELDTDAVVRARVVVEHRQPAFEEAGDLLIPIADGAIDGSHVVADLAELARGAPVRRSPEEVTVFKSVGMAFEDLVIARAAMEALA